MAGHNVIYLIFYIIYVHNTGRISHCNRDPEMRIKIASFNGHYAVKANCIRLGQVLTQLSRYRDANKDNKKVDESGPAAGQCTFSWSVKEDRQRPNPAQTCALHDNFIRSQPDKFES